LTSTVHHTASSEAGTGSKQRKRQRLPQCPFAVRLEHPVAGLRTPLTSEKIPVLVKLDLSSKPK